MKTTDDIVRASRRIAEALHPGDLDHTLARITAAAVDVMPDVAYASFTIKHADGKLETVAPTDDVLLGIDAAQYDLQEGPCYEAASDSVHVTAPDLANDPRFTRYAPVAVAVGISAQAGIRLFDVPKRGQGALNLYSERVGAFDDLGALGELFAHQSAVALAYAREISELQDAVLTRQRIGQAVGVVMGQYELDEARAFGFLARVSSQENIKLRVVADRLLEARASAGADQPQIPL